MSVALINANLDDFVIVLHRLFHTGLFPSYFKISSMTDTYKTELLRKKIVGH